MPKSREKSKKKLNGSSLLEQLLVLSVITSILLRGLWSITHTNFAQRLSNAEQTHSKSNLSQVLLPISNKNKPANARGFTLIELLCVIAVMSSLFVLSIRFSREYLVEQRITHTAIEMENVLAAALNYQFTHHVWPNFHDNLNQCWQEPANKDEFIMDYLALKTHRHHLGEYFCWGASQDSGPRFWVALHLNAQAHLFAPRLLARLANSYLSADPNDPNEPPCDREHCFLVANTSAHPGAEQVDNHAIQLMQTGECQSEKNNTACQWQGNEGKEPKTAVFQIHFTCPNGYVKTLSASLNYLDVGKARGEPYVLRTMNLTSDCHVDYGCQLSIQAARSDNHSVTTGAYGHVGATYWAYCQRGHNASPL
jgi:prepilin-type N-terminal cleavage/methylation domain-containing protein